MIFQLKWTHDYLGINKDGLARVIIADDPQDPKWTASRVSRLIKDGYAVERLPHKEACDRFKVDGDKARRAKAEAAE